MKKALVLAAVALLLVFVSSCRTAAPPDTTAPQVVSLDPAAGAVGVTKTASISIVFNEPMDTASVEAAYSSDSEGIKPGQVTFTWQDDDKKLVVTPAAELAYSPNADFLTYSFVIGAGAQDKAGNPLATAVSSSFSTMRSLYAQLEGEAALDGSVAVYGSAVTDRDSIFVGEDDGGASSKAFFSFPLKDLPADAESIKWAELEVYTVSAHDPDNDHCRLDLVDYGESLDGDDYALAALGEMPVFPSRVAGWSKYGLTGWVQQRFTAGSAHFQVRFDYLGSGDGVTEYGYRFNSADADDYRPVLKVVYYGP